MQILSTNNTSSSWITTELYSSHKNARKSPKDYTVLNNRFLYYSEDLTLWMYTISEKK